MPSREFQSFWVVALTLIGAIIAFFNLRQSFCKVRPGFSSAVARKLAASLRRTWLVGGMMGSGKTTFARSLAEQTGTPHLEIDHYPGEETIFEAITRSTRGWIAEANPWQIPDLLVKDADIIVFLDYDSAVNYVRLLRRGCGEWRVQGLSLAGFKQIMIDRTILDLGRIVFLYGRANRQGWRETGLLPGIDTSTTVSIRCTSPAELEILLGEAVHKRLQDGSPGLEL